MLKSSLSIVIGALIAIMILFNGMLATLYGNYLSSVIIHSVGLITIITALIFTKSKIKIKERLPLYLYSAGALGVLTVLFNTITFTAIGASLTLALGLLGQSIVSLIVDHYGLFGVEKVRFNSKKYVGLILICIGIALMAIA